MELKEKIQEFNKIKEEIAEYFGEPIYDGFDDMTAVKWNYSDAGVQWEEKNEMYSEEASMISEKVDFSLINIHACTGERYYAIFTNDLIDNTLDEY
tara:strand:- start:15413 stop:15700 length:288 start_codon:yes stop_codon:yes gene_type:complete